MTTLTAVPGWGSRAILTIDLEGATTLGTMTLWRIEPDGTEVPVAGAAGIPAVSTVVADVAAGLVRVLSWRVDFTGGPSATSNTLTIASVPAPYGAGMCLVTHPVTGMTAPVIVVSWTDLDREGQGAALVIPGRDEPIELTDVEMLPTAPLELLTLTADDEAALDALLAAGEIVLLRTVDPGYPDTFIKVRRRNTKRLTRRGMPRLHSVDVQHHRHPSPETRATGDTLQNLHDAVPTDLQAIADRWPGDLLDIAAADLMSEVSG